MVLELKNAFSEETRELFIWNKECWWCKANHWDCLHHILGRISDSPLNVAPLNNFVCHIGNGKLSQFDIKKKLLNKTLDYLLESGYSLTKKDKEFKKEHHIYYKN